MSRSRLTLAGFTAGIVFAAGLVVLLMVPGLGGTSKTKDFTDFYGSSNRRDAAALLGFVLLVGGWLMVWLFTELRARLLPSTRTDLAYHLGVAGTVAVVIGAAVELAPTMVQSNTDNGGFVGIPVAHAFAQAGFGVALMGLLTCAAAVFLDGLEIRRGVDLPRWLGTASVVIAVLLVGSVFAAPAFLLPVWAVVVGLGARRAPAADAGARTRDADAPLRVRESIS